MIQTSGDLREMGTIDGFCSSFARINGSDPRSALVRIRALGLARVIKVIQVDYLWDAK